MISATEEISPNVANRMRTQVREMQQQRDLQIKLEKAQEELQDQRKDYEHQLRSLQS